MSWAAHEFENYFLQKHVGLKASFFGLVFGALSTDLFTKAFVYQAEDPAKFHRGWPGVGFTHSFGFGVLMAVIFLAVTRNRSWALGVLIGQWAHVLTDTCDTAGVMLFFPFSTEPVSISMWKHAAVAGRNGDATAYYSSLGGVWDFFWLCMVLLFARVTLTAKYFRDVVIPADPRSWAWLHRRLHLDERGLLAIYRGFLFYGAARMTAWFLYARFDVQAPFSIAWNGPAFVESNDISKTGFVEVCIRTAIGGVLFAGALVVLWKLFIGRLWDRAEDPPSVERGRGLSAVFGE